MLQFRTRRQLKTNTATRSSVPFKKARRIGILFTIDDRKKHEQVKQLIHRLEQEGKQVEAFAFLPPKRENHEFLFDFFTPEDVSVWGKIKSRNALRFADTPFDFLLCLDVNPGIYVQYLLARSKARCRAGIFGENLKPYFELMIHKPRTDIQLIEHLLQFTTHLK